MRQERSRLSLVPSSVARTASANPNSHGSADTLTFEVACYAASYAGAVELAEACELGAGSKSERRYTT